MRRASNDSLHEGTRIAPRIDRALRVVGVLGGAAGFALLLWYLGRMAGAGEIRFERLRIDYLLGAFALMALSFCGQVSMWHVLLQAGHAKNAWRVDAMRWALSLVGKYLPGKVFHAVGRWHLYRDLPDANLRVPSAYVAEVVMNLSAAAAIATIALLVAVQDMPVPPIIILAMAAIAVAGFAASLWSIPQLTFNRIVRAMRGLELSHNAIPANRARTYALALGAHTAMAAGFCMLANSLEPLPVSLVPLLIGSLCASGIVGMAAFFVPAGIGVRDGALAWLLSLALPVPLAVLIAVAARLWTSLGEAIAIGIGWLAARHGSRK